MSTFYYTTAFSPSEFEDLPEVKEYDDRVENITALDDWSRTQFYWSNNFSVTALFAVTFPAYFGANGVVLTGYQVGLAMAYYYHLFGPAGILAFTSTIFVHGILELTAVFIVGGASLRLGWKLWGAVGRIIRSGKLKVTKRTRTSIKRHLTDYLYLIAFSFLLIFLAAPIESYVSPMFGALFFLFPGAAVVFLGLVVLFYASLVRRGFSPMLRDLASVSKDVDMLFSRKWRPTQLSLAMFIIFTLLVLLI